MASLKLMIKVAEQAVLDHVGTEVLSNDDDLLSSPLSSVASDFDREDRPDYLLEGSPPSQQRGPAELATEENPKFQIDHTAPLRSELPPESNRDGESHASSVAPPVSREQKAPAIGSKQTADRPNGSAKVMEAEPPSNFSGDAVPNFELPTQSLQEQDHSNHQEYKNPSSPSSTAVWPQKRPRPLEFGKGSETEPVSQRSSPSKKQRTDIDELNCAAMSASVRGTFADPHLSSPPSASSVKRIRGTDEQSTPSGRPSRKRAAPTRYDKELGSTSKSAKRSGPKAVNRSLGKRCWNADYLLQNPMSKLVYANLFGVLSDERGWTLLSSEEQRQLLTMLPEPVVTETSDGQTLPNAFQEYLKNNNAFQADVRLFQEDLSAGRYNGKWLADAKAAMSKRAEGKFDGWKEQQTEAFWGQKQKLNYKAVAGDSTTCKLATLVAAQCFRIGDVWSYSRGFGRKKANVTVVEKEAKIIAISATNGLSFSVPPGQHKLSSPANGKDLVVNDISGPQQLSTAILKEDGRITDPPNGNAWKEYRCWRDNQDIGSIWEIREAYYVRSNGVM